jgi:hypothetical protein
MMRWCLTRARLERAWTTGDASGPTRSALPSSALPRPPNGAQAYMGMQSKDKLRRPMVSIDEELEAAEAAKTAIEKLSPNIGAMIRKAKDIAAHAVTNLPSDWRLDDARCIVVAALSDLIDASENAPLQERIDEAKAAIEEWIECLE